MSQKVNKFNEFHIFQESKWNNIVLYDSVLNDNDVILHNMNVNV